ncbi:hypothetical protein WSM22_39320 [Cytophagales bacterium WSM2-2]|nr:hypothetical protein WSM22_39320 [Cytophagales bacterium WSM2-2]
MKSGCLLLLLTILVHTAFTQHFSSIAGKVIDAKTNEPLHRANVYLGNTAISVSANENGYFELTLIPPGKYDFTASILGYKLFSTKMVFSGDSITDYVIMLELAPIELEAVEVTAHKGKRNRYYSQFVKSFLGITQNARKCEILNPYDIVVDKVDNKIVAFSRKPIVIENKALGYKIYYELKEFKLDLFELTMSGIPRFEELVPETARQKNNWLKERDRAYYGSISHFLLSLKHNDLMRNYYETLTRTGKSLMRKEIMEDSVILYKGGISVNFNWEYPENAYPNSTSGNQSSTVIFNGQPIRVYDNGYFEDFHDVKFRGYLGWSSTVAELVPFGYKPTYQLRKKYDVWTAEDEARMQQR